MSRSRQLSAVCVAAGLLGGGCAEPAAGTDPAAGSEAEAPATPPSEPALRTPTQPAVVRPGVAVVARVVDGDTVVLRGGRTVRLVQIDTPEVRSGAECGGAAASAALSSLLPAGTRVALVRDPVSDNTDRYGRLLRYVIHRRRNINVWMVARGHAAPYFYGGERGQFAARLERDAAAARSQRLGIWGLCPNAVLDAYRGISTGVLGRGGASDAASAAGALSRIPAAPAFPPDVDCADLAGPVRVTRSDPHRLDEDGDGIGCD